MLPASTKQGKNKTARITPSHNASRSPSSLPSHLCRCFCFLCRPSLSFLSSLTRLFLIFAVLRRSPSSLSSSPSSLPSFAVVFAILLSSSQSFAVVFAIVFVVVRRCLRCRRRLCCPSVIVAKKCKTKNTTGPHISGPQFTHRSVVAVRMFSVRKLHVLPVPYAWFIDFAK